MIIRIIYCLIIIFFMTVLEGKAKTVIWSVRPVYQMIKPYSPSLYLCQLDGKWGVVDADGKTILPNRYDFITSQHNGIGLFGIVEGSRNLLNGFIRADGTCTTINGKYYVIANFPYFSEGKLCVSAPSGKQGYMNENGDIVIKCQFDAIRPFREGLASIKKGPWVYYIRENYDTAPEQNVVYAEWRNGEITEGSSFKNGEAVVGYGGKYRVIDKQGRELRNFSASNWKVNPIDYTIVYNEADSRDGIEPFTPQYTSIEVYSVDGKYGFRSDNEVILSPVLCSASSIDLNYVSIVTHNGKWGLLKIIEGSIKSTLLYDGNLADRIHVDSKGKADMLQYSITIPEMYRGHTSFLVDNGSGSLADVSSLATIDKGKLIYDFCPEINKSDKTKTIRCRLLYEDMEVLDDEFTLLVERPVKLRLSDPMVATAQADIKTEIQEVTATIYNDSEREVSVTATLSVNCQSNRAASRSFNITISSRSSRKISVPVRVSVDENAPAVIRLSTGEQKKSTVALKIY